MKLARIKSGGEAEIFRSIQGEGPTAGTPCIFVRAALCNLSCRWCDTDYTWNWEGTPYAHERDAEPGSAKYRKEDELIELSPEEVAARIAAFPCRRVVITGGEPLVQQWDWERVIAALQAREGDGGAYEFEVETNGTIAPGAGLVAAVSQWNVSPKLANSGVAGETRLRAGALRCFAGLPGAWFKFVVDREEDLDEVDELVREFGLPVARVMLMPRGVSPAELEARQGWVVEQCLARGFRYSDRLHVRLFGARRGV